MKTEKGDSARRAAIAGKGRAVITGYGLDDAGGHARVTTGEGFHLTGGSEATHREMQERMFRIKAELERRGLSLENASRSDAEEIRMVVDRFTRG